jgi:hypothetical protein
MRIGAPMVRTRAANIAATACRAVAANLGTRTGVSTLPAHEKDVPQRQPISLCLHLGRSAPHCVSSADEHRRAGIFQTVAPATTHAPASRCLPRTRRKATQRQLPPRSTCLRRTTQRPDAYRARGGIQFHSALIASMPQWSNCLVAPAFSATPVSRRLPSAQRHPIPLRF